jgi:hypothetical protein
VGWQLDSMGESLATAPHTGAWVLRTEHEPVSQDGRSELLARLAGGEHVELFLDAVTFSQAPGVTNRNFVRFDPARLADIAATGKGTPFLRDHAQRSMEAVGGIVVVSRAQENGQAVDFFQTARLTEPWAVRAAILETLRGFSIGWINLPVPGALTPAVTCSVCGRSVSDCAWDLGHWRGAEVAGQVVEWVIGNAELIETSGVPVPAVREVRPLGVREELSPAALAAELRTFGVSAQVPSAITQETRVDLSKIAAALGLKPDATEADILSAIHARAGELAAAQVENATLTALNTELRAAADVAETKARDVTARTWADQLVAQGKLAPQGPLFELLVQLHAADPGKAESVATALPTVTPLARAAQAAERASAALTLDDLVAQLSAEDRQACVAMAKKLSTAKRPMTEADCAKAYIKSNYAELAVVYGWPKEMP